MVQNVFNYLVILFLRERYAYETPMRVSNDGLDRVWLTSEQVRLRQNVNC